MTAISPEAILPRLVNTSCMISEEQAKREADDAGH